MGTFSSSSQHSKPLLALSLAVSLALHVGGLYFLVKHPFSVLRASPPPSHELTLAEVEIKEEEKEVDFALGDCLSRLIITEESLNSSSYVPQLENRLPPPFIMTDAPHFSPPKLPSTEVVLTFESLHPKLLASHYSPQKISPFKDKKAINFTRNIDPAPESHRPTLPPNPNQEIATLAPPQTEARDLKKHDFLNESESSHIAFESTPPTPPVDFKLQPSTPSKIIESPRKNKKQVATTSSQLPKPEISSISRTPSAEKERSSIAFTPSAERSHDLRLEKDLSFFFVESQIPRATPFAFTHPEPSKAPLMALPPLHQKETLSPSQFFDPAYVVAVPTSNFAQLNDKVDQKLFSPATEKVESGLALYDQTSNFTLPRYDSASISFDSPDKPAPVALPKSSVLPAKQVTFNETLVSVQEFPLLPLSPKPAAKSELEQAALSPQKEPFYVLSPKPIELPSLAFKVSGKEPITDFISESELDFTPSDQKYFPKQTFTPPSEIKLKKLNPHMNMLAQSSKQEQAFLEPSQEPVQPEFKPQDSSPELNLLATPKGHQKFSSQDQSYELTLQPSEKAFPKKDSEEFSSSLALSPTLRTPSETSDTKKLSAQPLLPSAESLPPPFEQTFSSVQQKAFSFSSPTSKVNPLDIDTTAPLSFQLSEIHAAKADRVLEPALTLPRLPFLEDTHVSIQKPVALPEAVLKDLSVSEDAFSSLILSSPSYPQSLNLLEMGSCPEEIPQKQPSLQDLKLTLQIPESKVSSAAKLGVDASKMLALKDPEFKADKKESLFEPQMTLPQLPKIQDTRFYPDKSLQAPNKVLEDLSASDTLLTTVTRSPSFPATKHLTEQVVCPDAGAIDRLPVRESISQPKLPAFYPPDTPSLAFNEELMPSLKENDVPFSKSLQPLQKGIQEKEMPSLPFIYDSSVKPAKKGSFPKSVLQDLAVANAFLEHVPKTPTFPLTQKLTSGAQAPEIELTGWTPDLKGELEGIETFKAESNPKKVITAYEKEKAQEASSFHLANPELATAIREEDMRVLNDDLRRTKGNLSQIPAPLDLQTLSYEEDFETEVEYKPRKDGKGYQFAVKLKPKKEFVFGSPKQNFIFIVDGSGTIKKHRYSVFKDGVGRALRYLKEGDSFNILVADSKVEAYGSKPVRWNSDAVRHAKRYLQKREYRGYFSNYDAFYLLKKAEKYFIPNKHNVVILLTDGHSFDNIKKHKEDLIQLSKESQGRFSLFTATTSQNNNLSMLDLVSTFNDGEMMYSPTHAAFPRKLAVLVKHIESFVAKDVRLHAVADQATDIDFYPNPTALPSIYSDRPYIIYGTTKSLQDFDLLVQGRTSDHYINIRQRISFKKAEKANSKLDRNFALQQAYVCYDYFLKEEDPFFLREAERLLTPHAIPSAAR